MRLEVDKEHLQFLRMVLYCSTSTPSEKETQTPLVKIPQQI